jgi:hypothetical protein
VDDLKRPADEADCFKHRREACRNEVEAIFDILVLFEYVDLIRCKRGEEVNNKLYARPKNGSEGFSLCDWLNQAE